MKLFKIGEEVKFKEDFEVQTMLLKKQKVVKTIDRNFIDKNAFLHILTGECSGSKVKLEDVDINGYDIDNIANMLLKKLNYFSITEELDDKKFVFESIKDSLHQIIIFLNENKDKNNYLELITEKIMANLDYDFDLYEALENLDIEKSELKDEFEDLLMDIF